MTYCIVIISFNVEIWPSNYSISANTDKGYTILLLFNLFNHFQVWVSTQHYSRILSAFVAFSWIIWSPVTYPCFPPQNIMYKIWRSQFWLGLNSKLDDKLMLSLQKLIPVHYSYLLWHCNRLETLCHCTAVAEATLINLHASRYIRLSSSV